ncbi:hypothetical protein RDABS01_018054 [Bienertia sinuspersici]
MSSIHQVQLGKVVVTTHVITTVEQLDQSLRELLWLTAQHEGLKRVVALDIDKHYSPSASTKYTEKVATLTLCCGNSCLIIQLLQMDSLYASCYISEFLQLHQLTFVGLRIQHSLEALDRDYGIKCRNAVELSRILGSNDGKKWLLEGYGLFDLACKAANMHAFMGVNESRQIYNAANLTDWGATTLSKRQIKSATMRAYLCFYVSNYLYGGYCKRFRFWDRGYDDYYNKSRCLQFIDYLACWIWVIVSVWFCMF